MNIALYDSYHEIVNLTRIDEDKCWVADVVGPICETGDILGTKRKLPKCVHDDVILIAT
jgi:diaminopimelate decarboxylase/aspartate kinase